jgi:molybdenum-dependent DNA-binding transcriptional regulator ModE
MTELEKIDELRKRLHLSYREAREALERANGDLLEALVQNEADTKADVQSELERWSARLAERVRNILRQGNVTRIIIKKDGKIVAEVPATVGALGVVGVLLSAELAILAGIGTVAALFNRYTLEIERPDGTVEEHSLDINSEVDN